MKKLVNLLAPLGLLVIAGSVVAQEMGKTLPGKPEVYLVAGFALIVTQILLRFEDIAKAIGARQLRYGSNTFAFSLIVLGILAAVNYLAARHPERWDLTKNKKYSLSDQSKKVLENLKEDVKLTYFAKTEDLPLGKERLKVYEATSPRLKLAFVDPLKSPALARQLGLSAPLPNLIFERGTRREKITNDSEQDITNALIKVTRDTKKTVCFVGGEGERDPDDSRDVGFSQAKTALTRAQYDVKKVILIQEGKIPADCTVAVIAGPEKDLLPKEIDFLRSFVKEGGKALVMVEPEFKESYSNLTSLLKEWNIETAKDVVVDASGTGQLFGAGPITPIAAQYPYHEITKDFRVMTAFHEARSMEAGKGTVAGVTAQNLVETAPQSWAESDLALKEPIEFNEGKDRKGPISLAVAATIRPPNDKPSDSKGEEAKKVEGRVVAFGDSDFASNTMLGFQGNRDFFLNTVAWLAEDADLIAIRPREAEDQRLFLTRAQQQLFLFLAIFGLPGAFVVSGIASWLRRR